eukprot:6183986-Pleurochrysis_carterae.AAC.1
MFLPPSCGGDLRRSRFARKMPDASPSLLHFGAMCVRRRRPGPCQESRGACCAGALPVCPPPAS